MFDFLRLILLLVFRFNINIDIYLSINIYPEIIIVFWEIAKLITKEIIKLNQTLRKRKKSRQR